MKQCLGSVFIYDEGPNGRCRGRTLINEHFFFCWQVPAINCNPYVTHQDINAKSDECNCSDCRLVMQKARVIVTEAESWARKNFEITIYGSHIAYCFYAGKRSHQVTVQMVGGEIQVQTNINSWSEWLNALVRRNWGKFLNAAFKIGGSIISGFLRGGALKALTFK
jgi:hypothetical protein